MKKNSIKILFYTLCLLFLMVTIGAEAKAAQPQSSQFRSYLRQGIEKAFNLEKQSAIAYLQKAVDMDRETPAGYAFLALAHMFFYEMSFEPKDREGNQEAMLRYVSDALAKGEKQIRENSKNDQAHLAIALAKIAKIRWAIGQKRYLIVAQETSNIWDYLEKAKEGNSQNYDIYFSMGLLHYHLDHLTGATRFFSSLMITSGDRQKGLQELELAARRGDLLKELAQAELASVYLNFEKQPGRALPIARALKGKYPSNYNFSFALANTYSDLRKFEEAFAIARDIEKYIRTGNGSAVSPLKPRYDQLMGRIFFSKKEYARASEYFQKALQDKAQYNARVRAWAFVRLGMIHDIRKEREQAEEYYASALSVEGGEGAAQVEARKYLKGPYVPPP